MLNTVTSLAAEPIVSRISETAGVGTRQTSKIVYHVPDYLGDTPELLEQHIYDYDASGRMIEVTVDKTASGGGVVVEEYGYNDQNLRVSRSVTESGNTTVTEYLLDTNNPTGYSQILEESISDELSKTYTIGRDVIAQFDFTNGLLMLLYDGHGSTRALVDGYAQVVQRYAYDAYGNILEGEGLTSAAAAYTTMLYSGESFNARTGFQNLRTRELRLSTGTFPTMDDPRYGKIHDPISLNKYLYVHANPVMGVDPGGTEFTIPSLIQTIGARAQLYVGSVGSLVAAAFRDGGQAVGRVWNALHAQASYFAQQVFATFPRLTVVPRSILETPAGQRIIDFALKHGSKLANFEIKYKLPAQSGDALNRLAGQINAMVAQMPQQQAVVWTLKEPTLLEAQLLQRTVGTSAFSQVQFVNGVQGLYHWVKLYFGL